METYLLLRSNKQSGPYSLQQLVNVGLKPYDLVWVEGKSAAWRYPSEVDNLKDYAPATEEQPYDRFYKKPEEKQQERPTIKAAEEKPISQPQPILATEPEPIAVKEIQPISPKEEVYARPAENKTVTSTKKVFVSMPGGNIATPRQPQPMITKSPAPEERPRLVEEKKPDPKPVYQQEEVKQPVLKEKPVLQNQEPVYKPQTIPVKTEPSLEEKYSESLDDIKRRYTETYLSRQKKSRWTSTHTSILQVFGGAVFFCFLVVVAYKNFAGEEKSQKTTVIQPDKRAINTSTVSTTPVTTPAAETEKDKPAKKSQASKPKSASKDESLAVGTIQEQLEEIKNEEELAVAEDKSLDKKAVMPKAEDEIKSEEPLKPETVKPKTRPVNMNRLVKVTANDYKQRAFGGVLNLELTVDNNSKFELDRVVVELQYLKPSEQPIKTERIVFNSIGANDSKTLKIPDYLRGVKISYRVTNIESSQYERQTAGL